MNQNSQKVNNFLSMYSNPKTRSCYKSYLNRFEKGLDDDLEAWLSKSKEEIMDDIKNILIQMERTPPKTKQTMTNAVKSLLEDNYIELPHRFWKRVNQLTKGGSLTDDRIPTKDELKTILEKGDVKEKAFFLVLATSGMYHGEALKIEEEDIRLEHEPSMIIIREEIANKGGKRTVFITKEAEFWLKKWLKIKQRYLDSKEKKHNFPWGEIDKYDPRVFPFSQSVSQKMWNRLIKHVGLEEFDKTTNRRTLHIHSLRKYFRTMLGPHMPQDIIETLMGHETQLQKAYRKYSINILGNAYLEAERELSIMQPLMNEEEIRERLEDLEEEKHRFTDKQKIWEERLKFQDDKIRIFEEIIRKNRYDVIDPIGSFELSEKARIYEEKERKKLIQKRNDELINKIKNDPRFKDFSVIYKKGVPMLLNNGEPVNGFKLLYEEIENRTKNPNELSPLIDDFKEKKSQYYFFELMLTEIKNKLENSR